MAVWDTVTAYLHRLQAGGYSPSAIFFEFLLIGAVVYSVLRFLHGTRGARLLQGVLFLVIAGFLVVRVLAEAFAWTRISILYQYFVMGVFLTTLVAFQPELRRGLMRLGETRWLRRYLGNRGAMVEPILQAVAKLSNKKVGALIAVQREGGLGAVAETGTRLDAILSADLLETIFWPGTALHDMGVIVAENQVVAAGCQFPLAESEEVDRGLGSRHRAAVGLSHESDALVIVVSEETGTISVAESGRLKRDLTPAELAMILTEGLQVASTSRDRKPATS
jgi:diadenylate cyclase